MAADTIGERFTEEDSDLSSWSSAFAPTPVLPAKSTQKKKKDKKTKKKKKTKSKKKSKKKDRELSVSADSARFWLQAALAVLSKVTWATVNRLSQSHCNLLTRALEGLFLTSRTWASTCSLRCGSQPHHRRGRTGPEHARNFSCALASAAPVTSDMSTHALIGLPLRQHLSFQCVSRWR